ncbi:MAG: hypothetical protein ACLP0J_20715 [Solirubrobacteraceae bacterium]
MSFISPTNALTATALGSTGLGSTGLGSTGLGSTGLGSTGLTPVSQADLPADIRNGSPAAKQAYTEGLEFAQVLVNELAQQLTATVSDQDSDDGDSSTNASGGGDDGSSDATSPLGSDPATSLYSSLIPQALSDSIMSSGGGLGIASEIAAALDPSLGTSS